MNRIILSTAAALAIATPVLADQPTTLLEVRQHFAADETGNEARIYLGDDQGTSPRAAEILAGIYSEDEDTNRDANAERFLGTMSSKGAVNDRAAEIFQRIDAEDRGLAD